MKKILFWAGILLSVFTASANAGFYSGPASAPDLDRYGLPFASSFSTLPQILPPPHTLTPTPTPTPNWGFFAHRRINRLAVLTLPMEMKVFFKPNIDWISDHAVDPDMRRYATKNEGPRHFIDLDQYGNAPFADLPRNRADALLAFTEIWTVGAGGDTSLLFGASKPVPDSMARSYKSYFIRQVLPKVYQDDVSLPADSLRAFLAGHHWQSTFKSAFLVDKLSEHGIVPWHLQKMQRDLTEAFRRKDSRRILRLCADMGHYIGDAHVPLHTTSNYNGQKTGQHGIHGFWESRIPELFADEQYDYFVGKPRYIDNTTDFFWKTVLESHELVDSVLEAEKRLRLNFPADRQLCPDMRLGVAIVAPCREFSAAYQNALNNMIERRMRDAIRAVGSVWYTAWVDAGQPDLSKMDVPPADQAEVDEELNVKKSFESGKILGRAEDH